ncbi:electron transfer flavoprotein subunit beta/FixA family protein [Radiobacillus sp. PE A8.2]|uniref:electron transfer flavoprotein subunit beta/FixA family protein n=1 Tax=Radiobacillus sp. PE A8.2 TaxID=3380349 RepID=UPI00388F67D8
MNIYVLMKSTFDTEEKIFVTDGHIDDDGVERIINPYDEYAIEEAIVLRDQHGGSVTVVTVGDDESEKQLRTALAMGADQAVLINTEEDDIKVVDPSMTVELLTAYLKDQEVDIILAGNVAIDGASGQVGPRLADRLDIACVTTITKIAIDGDRAEIERDVEGDTEIVEASLPLLVTCQQGLNEPRYPSLPGIMKAKKKPLEKLDLDDLELDEDDITAKTKTLEVFLPPERQAGKVLEGEINDQVIELVNLLKSEAKVL